MFVPKTFRDFFLYDHGQIERLGIDLIHIRVKGSCRDVFGNDHQINEDIDTVMF